MVNSLIKRSGIALLFAVVLSLACGCRTTATFTNTYVKRGVDFRGFSRVGVIAFTDAPGQPSSGEEVSDMFGVELLRRGYDIVERTQMDAIVREQEFAVGDLIDTRTAMEVGRMSGVSAVLVGNVGRYKHRVEHVPTTTIPIPVFGTDANGNVVVTGSIPITVPAHDVHTYDVSLSQRLIDVETGMVLWSSTGSKIGDDTLQEAAHAIVGDIADELPRI